MSLTYTSHYETVEDQFVQVGSDVPTMVNSIVSGIDTDELDGQRKLNASYRKFLQEQKK